MEYIANDDSEPRPGVARWTMKVSSSLVRSKHWSSSPAEASKFGDGRHDRLPLSFARVARLIPMAKLFFEQRALAIIDVHPPQYAYTIAKLPVYALIVTR